MYRVAYYISGGFRTAKYFESLRDALQFSVYQVDLDNFYELTKEE